MTEVLNLPHWWRPPGVGEGQSDLSHGVRRSGFFSLWEAMDAGTRIGEWVDDATAISARAELRWGEHCVECAAPACYQACDLYHARDDGSCRRFEHGIRRVGAEATLRDFSDEVIFLPWGNLLATIPGELDAYDGFLLQVVNPADWPVRVFIDFRTAAGVDRRRFMVQEQVAPGRNQFYYPLSFLGGALGGEPPRNVAIAPDSGAGSTRLLFPALDFVRWSRPLAPTWDLRRIKGVAVDLDGTLWRGVLVERGGAGLVVDAAVVAALATLRDHGMAVSIVSRNDEVEARAALEGLGLLEGFVFPQINWHSKSSNLRRLADALRVSPDALALIDDSAAERLEVNNGLPGVQCLRPSELILLASEVAAGTHPGVAPGATPGATLVTEVARHRFELYRQEEHRQRAQQGAAGSNRDEFLRALGTRVSMDQPTGDDVARIHELVQRTNRLNWTGHRYHRPEIEALLADSDKVRCWVIRAADRFGDYGLVGFAVVRVDAPECWRIRDLMFSCRILDREVDLFALTQIFQCAADQGTARVVATFRPSAHNEAAAATLRAAGLKATAEPSLFSITLADGWPVVEHIDRDASRP